MPRETLNLQRVSVLLQAYSAELIELDENDLIRIESVLKHSLKAITP